MYLWTNLKKYLEKHQHTFETASFKVSAKGHWTSDPLHLHRSTHSELLTSFVSLQIKDPALPLILMFPVSCPCLSCWTAAPVSVGWPRSWQIWCRPVDGCDRCKRLHWTRWQQCEDLGPSWRCTRGWRSGSAPRLCTSWRNKIRGEMSTSDEGFYTNWFLDRILALQTINFLGFSDLSSSTTPRTNIFTSNTGDILRTHKMLKLK